MEKELRVSIDRIWIVYPLSNPSEFSGLLTSLWSNAGEPGVKIKSVKYTTTATIPLALGQSLVVTAGMAQKFCYGKYDFKPADLTDEGWERLFVELGYRLDFGYASLLTSGYVNYLEIAVDVKPVVAKDLLPFDSKIRTSKWWPSFADPTPTAYLGTRLSDRGFRVYDRVARLKKLGVEIDGPIARIEATVRRSKCSILNLASIPNPFATFGVCRFEDLDAFDGGDFWKTFLMHCRESGSAHALALAGPMRKKYLGYLSQLCCEWWNSNEIWSMYPKALEALIPPPSVKTVF